MQTTWVSVLVWVAVVVAGAVRVCAADLRVVESEIFDAVAYEEASCTLTLLFDSGEAYEFFGVSRDVFVDFTRIVNHGAYFNRHVRAVYRCARVDRWRGDWAARE